MFAPFKLREMELKNRIVVSPMAQYKAVDGCPTDWHLIHYGERAKGGAGLVFTEMTCVSAEGRITPGCPGLYAPEHEARGGASPISCMPRQREDLLPDRPFRAQGLDPIGWEGMDAPLERWQLGDLAPRHSVVAGNPPRARSPAPKWTACAISLQRFRRWPSAPAST
jgi:anthraniloyl-CoA monooxygenase